MPQTSFLSSMWWFSLPAGAGHFQCVLEVLKMPSNITLDWEGIFPRCIATQLALLPLLRHLCCQLWINLPLHRIWEAVYSTALCCLWPSICGPCPGEACREIEAARQIQIWTLGGQGLGSGGPASVLQISGPRILPALAPAWLPSLGDQPLTRQNLWSRAAWGAALPAPAASPGPLHPGRGPGPLFSHWVTFSWKIQRICAKHPSWAHGSLQNWFDKYIITGVWLDEDSEEQSGFRVVMAAGEQPADSGPGHLSVAVLPRDARTFMFHGPWSAHWYTLSRQKEKAPRTTWSRENCGCRRRSQQVSTGAPALLEGGSPGVFQKAPATQKLGEDCQKPLSN